jgi:hypothetical protein
VTKSKITELVGYSDWIVGVIHRRSAGYLCWVINPELEVLNDGEFHESSQAALASGRSLVHSSTGPQIDFSRCRLYQD